MGGCGLSCPDNFLQEIKKLKETNAESEQVEMELRQHCQVAYSKGVRERTFSENAR